MQLHKILIFFNFKFHTVVFGGTTKEAVLFSVLFF